MIDKLYELQKTLVDAHGGIMPLKEGESIQALPSFMNAFIGITVESAEVLDEVAKLSRTWKSPEDTLQNIKEELIDVYFYLLESFMLIGATPEDIYTLYLEKYYWNMARIIISGPKEYSVQTLIAVNALQEIGIPAVNLNCLSESVIKSIIKGQIKKLVNQK